MPFGDVAWFEARASAGMAEVDGQCYGLMLVREKCGGRLLAIVGHFDDAAAPLALKQAK